MQEGLDNTEAFCERCSIQVDDFDAFMAHNWSILEEIDKPKMMEEYGISQKHTAEDRKEEVKRRKKR